MPELNAIGIVVSDMARSIRFYQVVGFDVPDTPDEGHVDTSLPNGMRLMLDTEDTILSFRPDWTRETGPGAAVGTTTGASTCGTGSTLLPLSAVADVWAAAGSAAAGVCTAGAAWTGVTPAGM